MKFEELYFEDDTFNMPIDFDLCSFDKDGKLNIGLPMKYLSELVKYDVIRLSHEGKTFKSLNEAYGHYDSLNESKKKNSGVPKGKQTGWKYKTKVVDPETGDEREFEVAAGNVKIGGNTILLNMSTAKSCMSAIIGTCSLSKNGWCYSDRGEKQHDISLNKNIRHENQWACMTPLGIAKGLTQITSVLKGIKYIRVNESGEFRNLPTSPEMLAKVPADMKIKLAGVDDVAKLAAVGKALIELGSPLKMYTYTHRTDLSVGNLGDNVCVNGSGYMLDNAFIPVAYEDFNAIMDKRAEGTLKSFNGVPVTSSRQCLGDCRICSFCKEKSGKHIFLPIHGSGTKFYVALQTILKDVISHPEFSKLIVSTLPMDVRCRAARDLIPEETQKTFRRMVPLVSDQLELFEKIFKADKNIKGLFDALAEYSSSSNMVVNGDNVKVDVSSDDSRAGLIASIDSLSGKFVANLDLAKAAGQKTATKKWESFIKQLNIAIDTAKSGEIPKIGKAMAGHHAGVFKAMNKKLGV